MRRPGAVAVAVGALAVCAVLAGTPVCATSVSVPVCAAFAGVALAQDLQSESTANDVERDSDSDSADDARELHAAWSALLGRYVEDGRVDYEGLRSSRAELDAYLRSLESAAAELKWLQPNDQLAYWINAYNAYTIALILDHWPVKSIWDVTPLWRRALGGPFALDFIGLGAAAPELAKPRLSLDDVEHRIVRKRSTDARVHFALVCASRGCPPLAGEAYVGPKLDTQLDAAARRFLADAAKNRYEPEREVLVLSPIFRWYEADFASMGGALAVFHRYAPLAAAAAMSSSARPPSVEYSPYDWSLNAKS